MHSCVLYGQVKAMQVTLFISNAVLLLCRISIPIYPLFHSATTRKPALWFPSVEWTYVEGILDRLVKQPSVC